MTDALDTLLTTTPFATVRIGFCRHVDQQRRRLVPLQEESNRLQVNQHWQQLPALSSALDDTLSTLAEVALQLWPRWWGEDFATEPPGVTGLEAARLRLLDLQRRDKRLQRRWATAALGEVWRGCLPLGTAFPRRLQAAQLSRVLTDGELLLTLSCDQLAIPEDRLLDLAQSASWLAETCPAAVVLLLSDSLINHPALDGVNYAAVTLGDAETALPSPTRQPTEQRERLSPLIGHPHPFSPGEQLLAARLAVDDELAGLFSFNMPLISVLGNRWLVDLWWPAGRLVVEVDGYSIHSNPLSFSRDRQRDYELLLTDIVVLRLPHHEVMADPDTALDKIRHTVRWRQRPSTR